MWSLSRLAAVALVFVPAVAQAQLPPGVAEKFVEIGGIRTRYLEAGSGEPLVLVHGGNIGDGVNANRFDRNIAGFAARYHVYALDSLGQGFTDNPKRDADYTMEGQVAHTYAALKALGLGRVHLLGASRGAYQAARLALLHPEMARSLVLCNTATLAPETGDPNRRDKLVLTDQPKDLRGAEIHRLRQLSFSEEHITKETVDIAVRIMEQPKSVAARAKMEALGKDAGFPDQKADTLRRLEAGELKVPTLMVWGYNDRSAILPNAIALYDILAKGNPDARMYLMNQAGHYDYREHAAEFDGVVLAFLQSLGRQ